MNATKPLTAGEHDALLRVRYATAREDRSKCGLEYIGRLLDFARGNAEAAAERILPEVADVKLNPAPSLASLCATPPGWTPALNLSELGELIFAQLQKEVALKPDVELLYHGSKRLETFASDWFVFLFGWRNDGGCFAFMRKKIALARAVRKHGAADKLDEAFRQLMPTFPLKDCGDKEAKRFAAEITPDDFHKALRTALKLDAEATNAINSGPASNTHKPAEDKKRKRFPKDKEALATLAEAARRKSEKAYSGDSSKAIILRMIEEPQSKWTARILHGKLKSKASGQVRTHNKPLDKDKAADNWGKYLSAYLKDLPSK